MLPPDPPDEVEVEQLLAGARPLDRASTGAAAAAVAQLTARGRTAEQIAVLLRCSSRQITRYRSALRSVS